MGVNDRTIQNFLENDFCTPADRLRLVDALSGMSRVQGRPVFVERAAAANSRDLSYFLVRKAELITAYQKSKGGIVQFVSFGGLPVNILANGRVLIIAPIDELSWSETPLKAMAVISDALHNGGRTRTGELQITGQATPMARDALHSMGWTVVEAPAP